MREHICFMVFWAINDILEIHTLKEQLTEFKKLGFRGVVFQPRFYPNHPEYLSPEYFEILSEIIIFAKQAGMEFWLYDENGWPSGTAGGKVLEKNPDSRCEWLEYRDGEVVFAKKNAVNTLCVENCQDFIHMTYDGYKNGLTAEAFSYVTGFFSDEVGFLDGHSAAFCSAGVPWCPEISRRYKEKYGETLEKSLPLLFEEKGEYLVVRSRYWELLTDILNDNFYSPIKEWCHKNGKKYTAHLKGEENPYFQVSYSGSVYQILKNVEVPAVDALERYPGNHYYPHIASSIARQFFDGDCLCEAMGGSGWGLDPRTFTDYVKWLIDCGITRLVFHLSQYRLTSAAIKDWPPSMPLHLTWKKAFPAILESLQEYAARVRETARERLLVVCPTRGVMANFRPQEFGCINEHNGDGTPDSVCGRISSEFLELVEQIYRDGKAYDVTEERIVEEYGTRTADGIRIGNVTYRSVVLGKGCIFRDLGVEQYLHSLECKPEFEQGAWKMTDPGENQLLLESDNNEYSFYIKGKKAIGRINIFCPDKVQKALLNGRELSVERGADGTCMTVGEEYLYEGKNSLSIAADASEPFLFVRGRFRVESGQPWKKKGERQLAATGPFFITPDRDDGKEQEKWDFIREGRPFQNVPVELEKEITFHDKTDALILRDTDADMVEYSIDNSPYEYSFDYQLKIPEEIRGVKGKHLVRVRLYPSTFNMYGPHHHIDGDRHLTSPAQYEGKKNFADFEDAPECTRVPEWHFVRFGIGSIRKGGLLL